MFKTFFSGKLSLIPKGSCPLRNNFLQNSSQYVGLIIAQSLLLTYDYLFLPVLKDTGKSISVFLLFTQAPYLKICSVGKEVNYLYCIRKKRRKKKEKENNSKIEDLYKML